MSTEPIYVLAHQRRILNDQVLEVPDTDRQGRTIFRNDYTPTPIEQDKLTQSIERCIDVVGQAMRAGVASGDSLTIDSVTVRLAIDAKLGCQAALEIKLRSRPQRSG
jgi:hypothetical protein